MGCSSATNSSIWPGIGLIVLCVAMLLAGYAVAAMRPLVATATEVETAALMP